MNTTNSYTLKCLEEEYSAAGAFLSNELSNKQLRYIRRPNQMRTFYSVYHPNTLLTSRQCLFQQTEGCKKIKVNKGCLRRCNKRTSIINLKDNPYVVQKQRGSHNSIYSDLNTLNLDVLNDHRDLITDVFIDLRDIQTETKVLGSKQDIINAFQLELARSGDNPSSAVTTLIAPTRNQQYQKGI